MLKEQNKVYLKNKEIYLRAKLREGKKKSIIHIRKGEYRFESMEYNEEENRRYAFNDLSNFLEGWNIHSFDFYVLDKPSEIEKARKEILVFSLNKGIDGYAG